MRLVVTAASANGAMHGKAALGPQICLPGDPEHRQAFPPMRIIENVRGRRQWNAMAYRESRMMDRLRERLHQEQPDAVTFVRDFVRTLSEGAEDGGEDAGNSTMASLSEPDDVLLLRHVAALYEILTREAGHRLRRVQRPDLEDALQQLMLSRSEQAAVSLGLISGCAQPEVFGGIQSSLMGDFSTRSPKRLVSGSVIVRVLVDAFDAAAEAAETTSGDPDGIWTLDRVEETLSVCGDPMRREALAAAESLREALVPRLVAELERWLSDPAAMDTQDAALGMHSLYLLASWREPSAVGVALRLFRLNDAVGDRLMAEARLTDGALWLASVVGRSSDRLLEIVRDSAASEFHRGVALEAFGLLFAWKEMERSQLLKVVRDLFEGELTPRRHGFEWYALLNLVMHLGLAEVSAAAEQALRNGHVDPALLSMREFRETLRDSARSEIDETTPGYGRLRDVASATSWLDDDPLAMERVLDSTPCSEPALPMPYLAPVAVGRNDPCPCGSGRKYKKCCGA